MLGSLKSLRFCPVISICGQYFVYFNEKLSLVLFMFIQQACPHLRRINFDCLHSLTDDFLQDVQLIFPSILDMYFGILVDVIARITPSVSVYLKREKYKSPST
jgi:hypothetical protein